MAKKPKIEPFPVAPGSDLSGEHTLINAFIEEANAARRHYYLDVDLKSTSAGEQILGAKPDAARRIVIAAIEQTRHWDEMAERVRSQGETETERVNAHHLPGWEEVWSKRSAAAAVVKALTRRKLPFERSDLLLAMQWCAASDRMSSYWFPVGNLARALQRFAEANELDDEFVVALRGLASQLRSAYDKDVKRHATAIEQLTPTSEQQDEDDQEPIDVKPSPEPGPAGSSLVLVQLKRRLGMLESDDVAETTSVGPDAFPLVADSPLEEEHSFLSRVLEQAIASRAYSSMRRISSRELRAELPKSSPARLFLAAAERQINALLGPSDDGDNPAGWYGSYAAASAMQLVDARDIEWNRDEAFDAALSLSTARPDSRTVDHATLKQLVELFERFAEESELTEGERYTLALFRASLVAGPALGSVSEEVSLLTGLIGDGAAFCLAPGEAWADQVNQDYARWRKREQRDWNDLFSHCLTATSSRPSKKWLKTAAEAINAIGQEAVVERLTRWLPEVSRGRSVRQLGHYSGDTRGAADTMQDENATILRGLMWVVPTLKQRDQLARLVSDVTLSAYRKVPGVGPRAVKVGNAGVYALSELGTTDAVGQLAVLKVRVKFGTAQKEIEKAFTKTAEALGLPRDEIEEMGVPSYGLTEVGRLSESVGEHQAEISVTGVDAALSWRDAKGKTLKSVPAKVRADHSDNLKELRQTLKDIKAMLPAQRDRIDSMFLGQRSWSIAAWRERYLNHPLVGTVARRLIWCVDGEPVVFDGDAATGGDGSTVTHGSTAEITLWHPVGQPVVQVVAWRERLEEMQLTQPFKQAHREVYLLTAAEENTGTYSNRFAAHVIRQHQFNALCSARGWKNQLRLMVDDSYYPPTKLLPQWNLRAEFWVEGIGENYGTDTNEAGSYLYLATDQVRFYKMDAAENWAHAGGGGYTTAAAGPGQGDINEPLPLEEVPQLVFSEVMRDVDLFVGVASVGNDPNWQDGGPEGRYQEYWTSYSFGELSESAATRKAVLERMVPRLKIADRCSFSDRFLVVKGDVRTYKIHLGSGNILMEPNDEYLCIVPDSRPRSTDGGDVYLPFEGDRTLSIVLSKALLLAADTKIKDPTILQQIKR